MATLCLVAFAPAAHAITPLRPLGYALGPVVGDGSRYAAYDPVQGVTRVIDTLGAESRVVSRPDRCQTAALAAGLLVWGCGSRCPGQALEFASIYDLAAGTVREVSLGEPPCRSNAADDSRTVLAVGAQWIAYRARGYHYQETDYVNHRDGRTAGEPSVSTRNPDLDAPSGQVHMCAPMSREREEAIEQVHDGYRPFAYDPPWGLTTAGGYVDSGPDQPRRLLLYRCGHRARRISRCERGCLLSTLGAGIAIWVEDRTVWALELRTGRRRRWRVASPPRVEGVTHTRTRLFVSTIDYSGGTLGRPPERRVYSASLKGL